MAFKPTEFGARVSGAVVATDRHALARELERLLATHGGIGATATALGVDRHTVQRWARRLGVETPARIRKPEAVRDVAENRHGETS